MIITQNDYNLVLQRNKKTSIKLELYDSNNLLLDQLEGLIISLSPSIDVVLKSFSAPPCTIP